MLKIIATLFFSFFIIFISYPQESELSWLRIKDNPQNYFSIVENHQNWLNGSPSDSSPQKNRAGEKDFYRFVHFWNARLSTDKNGNLSYGEYFKVAKAASENKEHTNAGIANWELVGPESFTTQNIGLVDEVLFDPFSPGNYLLSPNHGGIWKSRQTGNSWENVTDAIALPGISASEMVRNPFNNNHIIASTKTGEWGISYGYGIIESFDNGDTWQVMESFTNDSFLKVNRVIVDPFDPDPTNGATFYAITSDQLYKSENSGVTWTEISAPIIDSGIIHNEYIDIELASNGDLFLTTLHFFGHNAQVFKRSNETWIDLNPNKSVFGSFQRARITQPDSSKIFLLCDTENDGRQIYKTTDFGDTWSFIIETPQHDWKNEIEYSPESNIVYIGGIHMHVFYDQPPYRYDTIKPLHVDIRDFEIIGLDNNGYEQVLTATDGGIMMLKLNPQDFKDYKQINLNGNHLPISNFIGMAANNSGNELVLGGAVHCWTHLLQNNTWKPISGGDGGDCAINWIDPSIYYFQNNELLIKVKNNTFDTIYDDAGWFIGMQYELNPNDPYIVYVGRPGKIVIYNEHSDSVEIKPLPEEMGNAGAMGINSNNDIFVARFGPIRNNIPNLFVKSVDNGNTWEDISQASVTDAYNSTTELKSALNWKQIMDILFNPNDPNEMWICVGGIRTDYKISNPDTLYPGKFRVLHSTDGGDSWNDYSEGLTSLPAVALEYHLASNNRVFVGTDAGVYYREPDMPAWESFSEGMPPGLVSDLDYELCSGYLYASMDSRGIYKTPLPFPGEPLMLPEGEFTWDITKRLTHDIILTEGARLTITSNVYMPEGKKIIVNPGGQLVIDGGKVTNTCGGMWHGIQVLGNPDKEQNEMDQGVVWIINGATIESSEYGVYAYKMENSNSDGSYTYSPGFEGGIIKARNASFINNKTAVQFSKYPFLCESYFHSCNFITDDRFLAETPPKCFIRVSEMNGLEILNCNFINESTTSFWHDGIYSFDSFITLDGICENKTQECSEWNYNLFENLKYGVYAIAATPNKYIDIRHSTFTNNFHGLYTGGMTGPRITSNNFYLNTTAANEGYGLFLDTSTDYWVEDNIFEKCDTCTKETGIGIIVNESGGDPNEIYLNVFNNVEFAINAQGQNRNEKNPNVGLVLKCNKYNNTINDQTILWVIPQQVSNKAGIGRSQGFSSQNIEDMAGNIFYHDNSKTDFDDLNNEADFIDYYFSSNTGNLSVAPKDLTANNVSEYAINTLKKWTFESACKSRVYNYTGEIDNARSTLIVANSEIELIENKLSLLIDDGNTLKLKNKVQNSSTSEAVSVYSELMEISPFLSETVLSCFIKNETVFPNAMVRDILVANPHSAKSPVILDLLDQRFAPMPAYQKAQIQAARNTQSQKQELESQLAGYNHKKANAINVLYHYYRNDVENPDAAYDSLLNLFQSDNTIKSMYRQAWLYLENEAYNLGIKLMDNIPLRFSLTENEQKEHLDLGSLYDILTGLSQNGIPIEMLNENQVAELQNISSSGNGIAKVYARNILFNLDMPEYKEPILFPDMAGSTETFDTYTNLLNTKAPQLLSVYPNPSKGYIFIEYKLEAEETATVEIKDVTGKLVYSKTLTELQQSISVHTPLWKAGVYIASLLINSESVESVKFTLIN